MKSCVQIIVPLIILFAIVFLLLGMRKDKGEKFYGTGAGEYPNYYVYQKKEMPFSDRTKGHITKSLPNMSSNNRIDKEPFSTCNDYCN